MRIVLVHSLEVPDDADAEALGRKCADWIRKLEGVTVVADSVSHNDREFQVAGVIKGKPAERWKVTVPAQDEAEAEAKAVKLKDDRGERVVADVTALTPSVALPVGK